MSYTIIIETKINVNIFLYLFLGSTKNPITSYTSQTNDSQANFKVSIYDYYKNVKNPFY